MLIVRCVEGSCSHDGSFVFREVTAVLQTVERRLVGLEGPLFGLVGLRSVGIDHSREWSKKPEVSTRDSCKACKTYPS